MSKELTEKFESDCLDCGFYYASIPDEGVVILRSSDRHYLETSDGDKIDILSAVPSYKELQKLKAQLKYALETLGQIARLSKDEVDAVQCASAICTIKQWGVE